MTLPNPWTMAAIEAALVSADMEDMARIPVWVAMDPPEDEAPGWAERICLSLVGHADAWVHGNALLGFGHLARTAGVIREPDAVRAAVAAGLVHADPVIRGQAHAAADDLAHFLGWRFA